MAGAGTYLMVEVLSLSDGGAGACLMGETGCLSDGGAGICKMVGVEACLMAGEGCTSSTVSSCGVAALSSESFCDPASALLRTSRLFLCLCASFLTCPSALPLLSRRTGLVSHFRSVFPGRLGPGEL